MADRYCPYCGELVPSTSLTCPKCYKKIPVMEPEKTSTGGGGGGSSSKRSGSSSSGNSRTIAILLAVIPGLVGLLGLGLLYKDHKSIPGVLLLGLGLLVFISAILILTSSIPILNIIIGFVAGFVYFLLYAGNFIATLMTA